MVTINRTKNKEEFEIGVQALTEIFIDKTRQIYCK